MPGTRWKDDPIQFFDTPRLPPGISLRSCPALLSAWDYSARQLNLVAETLRNEFDDEWFSIAFAGSYGRLDAGEQSDADFMVLVDNPPSEAEVAAVINRVRELFTGLGLSLPNPKGFFSKPVDINTITNTIGAADDNLHDLARRMVLLLEIKCVYNEPLCDKTVAKVLGAYMRYHRREPEKEPLFLLNEIIRYFRSICVNYELNFWHEHEKWAIRNAKLRHSRVLMYFGLLSLILNSSIKEDKLTYIRQHIDLTPLERICHVFADCGEKDVSRALGPYNIFISHLNDASFRGRLSLAEYNNRYDFPEYTLLKQTSIALSAELSRFILDRRGYWSQKIFGYLMF